MWLTSGKTYESLIGSGVNSFVTVANTGNPAFSGVPFSGSPIGNINYTYQISKYEITNKEYCLFLNSVDPFGEMTTGSSILLTLGASQPISLNNNLVAGNRYSVSGIWEKKPVISISAYAMTIFCYWLSKGAKQYDLETRTFTLLNGPGSLVTSVPSGTDFSTLPNNFRLLNSSEWFKAAYYNGSGNYSAYATQKDTAPLAVDATSSGDGDYKITNSLTSLKLDVLKNTSIFDKNNFVSNLETDIFVSNTLSVKNLVSNLEMDVIVLSDITKNIYASMNKQEVLLNNDSRKCEISNIDYNVLFSSENKNSQNISFGLVDTLLSFASSAIDSSTFSIDSLLSFGSRITEIHIVNMDYLISENKNYTFSELL